MHCTCRSLLNSTLLSTTLRSSIPPPTFLAPALAHLQSTASFSTSTRQAARRDGNPNRGTSALRRTGLNKKIKISFRPKDIPEPVLDPAKRSKVEVDEDHGLYGFLPSNESALPTPLEISSHGRGWTVPELRNKDWDDLHRLWWLCVKERNRMKTALLEIQRIGNVYGEGELETREKQVKLTMRGIKHVLTERWYTWENARVAAMEDEEVDLYADIDNGQSAYLPKSEAGELPTPLTVQEPLPEETTSPVPEGVIASDGTASRNGQRPSAS